MAVNRSGQGLGRNRMLDEREAAAGLLAPGHEPYAQRAQVDRLAVARADVARPLGRVEAAQRSRRASFHVRISSLQMVEQQSAMNLHTAPDVSIFIGQPWLTKR